MRKLTALLLVVSSLALAQTEPPKTQPKGKQPVQNVIFGDDLIECDGCILRPDADVVVSAPRAKFGNLIKIRVNFDDKLMASVHQL